MIKLTKLMSRISVVNILWYLFILCSTRGKCKFAFPLISDADSPSAGTHNNAAMLNPQLMDLPVRMRCSLQQRFLSSRERRQNKHLMRKSINALPKEQLCISFSPCVRKCGEYNTHTRCAAQIFPSEGFIFPLMAV